MVVDSSLYDRCVEATSARSRARLLPWKEDNAGQRSSLGDLRRWCLRQGWALDRLGGVARKGGHMARSGQKQGPQWWLPAYSPVRMILCTSR